jgi:hypothetical protein
MSYLLFWRQIYWHPGTFIRELRVLVTRTIHVLVDIKCVFSDEFKWLQNAHSYQILNIFGQLTHGRKLELFKKQ